MFRADLSVHGVRGISSTSVYVHYVTLIRRHVLTLHFIVSFSYVVFRRRI